MRTRVRNRATTIPRVNIKLKFANMGMFRFFCRALPFAEGMRAMTAILPSQEHRHKTRMFISYSRKDMTFADRLESALKARAIEVAIDRTDIYAFEDWWKRVETLIAQCDTIIFLLSPDSLRAESIAQKEVAFAASLNKRFAPIVWRPLNDSAVPEPLRRLNFILFEDETRFDESMNRLVEALETDI